jgi:hypothetical protein
MKTLLLVLISFMATCSKNMDTGKPISQGPETESVRALVMLDANLWMTENLAVNVPGSFCQAR